MALERYPPPLRRVVLLLWGAAFVWLVFVYGPTQFMEMNADLGWPVWRSGPTAVLGVAMIVVGVGVMLHCTGLFARVGRGTPVPAVPPEKLVIQGLYRYSRNPIYVADVTVWFGIFLFAGHAALLLYAVIATILIELVILLWEEPVLKRRFGSQYDAYRERVPRWLPLGFGGS
ncbi:MAG: isoprenylcysteine carboxylmethyltransferase family protein [Planctomycetes bacterium]|nr:isoprenylcysteine carboxylmethyltransferase family protein [Planctomycetota bacterium]